MVKRKICKREIKIMKDLSNLFNKYLEEYPEMKRVLESYNLSVEQYLCFLSKVLCFRKTHLSSDWLKHFKVVSTDSPKFVSGH